MRWLKYKTNMTCYRRCVMVNAHTCARNDQGLNGSTNPTKFHKIHLDYVLHATSYITSLLSPLDGIVPASSVVGFRHYLVTCHFDPNRAEREGAYNIEITFDLKSKLTLLWPRFNVTPIKLMVERKERKIWRNL